MCSNDVGHHLDYLEAAVNSDTPDIFVQYTLWLKDVLASRGISAQLLGTAFTTLSKFFETRLAPSEAGRLAAVLDAAAAALNGEMPPVLYGQTRLPAHKQAGHYGELVLQGQHKRAFALLRGAMQGGHSLTEVAVRLIQPALYEVGRLWQTGRITVSQEHLASAITQNAMAGAYLDATFAPPCGKSAMFACVEGGFHGIGLQMMSDAFDTAGWEVFNLGVNLPLRDLVTQVGQQRPHLLGLSVSLPGQLVLARRTIEALRSELGTACPEIWIGGLATLSAPQAWRIPRADAWAADAMHALEQVQ